MVSEIQQSLVHLELGIGSCDSVQQLGCPEVGDVGAGVLQQLAVVVLIQEGERVPRQPARARARLDDAEPYGRSPPLTALSPRTRNRTGVNMQHPR